MITIGVPAEGPDESRIGLSPETAKKLVKQGAKVLVRSGAGLGSHFSDEEYRAAGATIAVSDADAVSGADIVLTVRRPSLALVKAMKPSAMLTPMRNRIAKLARASLISLKTRCFCSTISRVISVIGLFSQSFR